jgi:putative ABC transport system ATP-binding protein
MTAGLGVRLESVTRHFATPAGTVHALDGISLEVEPGSSLGITGPSGCGKSTLLGLVAGLETPTGGRVSVGTHVISALPDAERARVRREEIGLIFQSDNLLPFLTAVENVALQLALHDPRGGLAACREAIANLGLAPHSDKLPDQLSGGQRQRVAVARALIHRPAVILADEPTGSLDPENSVLVTELLLEASRRWGVTLLLVTHDLQVARRLDRTVALRDGRLVADHAPRASAHPRAGPC